MTLSARTLQCYIRKVVSSIGEGGEGGLFECNNYNRQHIKISVPSIIFITIMDICVGHHLVDCLIQPRSQGLALSGKKRDPGNDVVTEEPFTARILSHTIGHMANSLPAQFSL